MNWPNDSYGNIRRNCWILPYSVLSLFINPWIWSNGLVKCISYENGSITLFFQDLVAISQCGTVWLIMVTSTLRQKLDGSIIVVWSIIWSSMGRIAEDVCWLVILMDAMRPTAWCLWTWRWFSLQWYCLCCAKWFPGDVRLSGDITMFTDCVLQCW